VTPLQVIPPRVGLTDPRTGLISREWYLFLLRSFERGDESAAAIAALDVRVDALEITTVALDGRVDALELGAISLDARVDALEAAPSGGASSALAVCNFGGSFTDKAQTVVSGQAWVTAASRITAQVLTPAGDDPDEMRLLDLRPVISDLVAGDGFTVTLYSEPEARGSYSVMCLGV
jgi:hypothetical protein